MYELFNYNAIVAYSVVVVFKVGFLVVIRFQIVSLT